MAAVDIVVSASLDGDPDNPSNFTLDTITDYQVILDPGASEVVSIAAAIPADMPKGVYRFVAEVDAANIVLESDETNNAAVTDQTVTVEAPFVDLVASFDGSTLPPSIIAGDPMLIDLSLTIRNDGDINAFEMIDVDFLLSPDATIENPGNFLLQTVFGHPPGPAPATL